MTRSPKSFEVSPGAILRQYSDEEVTVWVAEWLDVFGRDRRGINVKAYLWHIFSGGRYPSLSGKDAMAEYKRCVAPEYVVLSNDRDLAFETNLLPDMCSLSDWVVCPRNFAWTMAFTHEAGWLGPYFARHRDFVKLNDANLKKLQKATEAEAAKLQGWQ